MKNTLAEMIEGQRVCTIGPEDSIRSACITMTSVNVGALPVVDAVGVLLGMLSERDVIKRSVIVYRPSETTKVGKIMTPNPKWLAPDAKPEEAWQMMADGNFRHLPVCNDGRVVGIVSMRDFIPKSRSLLHRLQGKLGKMSMAEA